METVGRQVEQDIAGKIKRKTRVHWMLEIFFDDSGLCWFCCLSSVPTQS